MHRERGALGSAAFKISPYKLGGRPLQGWRPGAMALPPPPARHWAFVTNPAHPDVENWAIFEILGAVSISTTDRPTGRHTPGQATYARSDGPSCLLKQPPEVLLFRCLLWKARGCPGPFLPRASMGLLHRYVGVPRYVYGLLGPMEPP